MEAHPYWNLSLIERTVVRWQREEEMRQRQVTARDGEGSAYI